MEMARRCMVKIHALPHGFWLEVAICTTYVLDKCSLTSVPPKHCSLSLYMSSSIAASHPLLIYAFLVAWHMH